MPKRRKWTMPKWMEPYRDTFANTGGNTVEELMNNRTANAQNNLVLAALIVAVESQVILLTRLRERAMLAKIVQPAPLVRRTISG